MGLTQTRYPLELAFMFRWHKRERLYRPTRALMTVMTLACYCTFLPPLLHQPLSLKPHRLQPPVQSLPIWLKLQGLMLPPWHAQILSSVPARNSNLQTMTLFSLSSAKRLDSMSVSCEFWNVLPALSVSIYSCQLRDFIHCVIFQTTRH